LRDSVDNKCKTLNSIKKVIDDVVIYQKQQEFAVKTCSVELFVSLDL